MTKFGHKNLCVFLLILSGCTIYRQEIKLDKVWPDKNVWGSPTALASVREGYILTKSNDTLRGYIKMVTIYDYGYKIDNVPILPFGKTNKKDILKIKLEDIDYVRIISPKNRDSSDYMPVHSVMWLILGRKNNIKLCFQVWGDYYFNNTYWNEMILISGNEITEIPIRRAGNINSQAKYLLRFINKRYGQDFKKDHFTNEKAMINYILDKEDEK